MGIKDLWDKITGNTGPKLTKVSGDISTHSVKHLEVFTAEAMVIVELHAADIEKVLEIARSSTPGALATDTTTVIFCSHRSQRTAGQRSKEGLDFAVKLHHGR